MSDIIMDVKTKLRFPVIKAEARGQWHSIIPAITGIDSKYLTSTHKDCPINGCGGKDRFKFDDKDGNGTWYCNTGHSGRNAGDGFNFLEYHLNVSSSEALHLVAEYLGLIDGNGLTRKGVFRPVSKAKASPPEDSDGSRQKAINYSRDVLKQCAKTSTHPYLKIKGLDNANLSFLASKERHELTYICSKEKKEKIQTIYQDSLIIPIYDLGNISSVIGIQFIPPFVNKETGKHGKFYIANMPLKDGVHIIKGDETKYIAVVEGYATGLSVFLATGYTTVVAFDANSMLSKTERIQALYPGAELVFFADNEESRTGIKAASKASGLVAGKVVLTPEVKDWNDFHVKHGLELTREAINSIIDQDSKIPKVFNQGDRYGFIDLFTPIQIITNDGVITAPMIEAINNYQDSKCFCPITGNKSYIQSFCIYRLSDKFVLRPTVSNYHNEAIYDNFKGISNQRRLTKVKTKEDILAVLLLNSSRMGEQFISIEAIKEFIKNHWGELPSNLTLLFQRLIDAKVNKASKLSKADFSLYGKPLKLKQGSDGRLDWSPALTVNQAVLTAVKVTHGQGKTSDYSPNLIKQCNYQRPIYVTHRTKLGGQASHVIGMNDYRDSAAKEAAAIGLLDDLAVTIHSLKNLNFANQLAHSDLIIIDEASQLLRAIVKDPNLKKEAVNNFISCAKIALEKGAKIVLLDADLNQGDIEKFQKLFGINTSDVRVIEAEIPDRNYSVHVYPNAGNNHKKSCLLKLIKEDIKNNIPIVIGCEGMNTAMAIASILGDLFPKKKEKIKLITASTVSSEEAKGKSVIENIESNSLKWDVVIYTNVIGTGVSIEHKSPRFKKGYFLFTGSVLTPFEWLQMMRRFRNVKEFHVEVYIKPLYARMVSFYKNLGKDEFEKEASEDALFALGLDIRHESAQFSDLSIPLFIHLLKHHKFTVHGELAKLGEKLPIKEVKEDKNQAIYNARILTESEYERLKKQESSGLSIEDQNAVKKHEIVKYFKRAITIDDVSLYENHSTRKRLDNFLMLTRKESLDERKVGALEESGLIKIFEEVLVSPVVIGKNRNNELVRSLKKTIKKFKVLGIAPESLCKDFTCGTTFLKNIFKELGFKVEESGRVRVGGKREYQLTIKPPEILCKRLNINSDTYGISPDKQAKEDIRETVLRLHKDGMGRKIISKITGIGETRIRTIINKNK